MNEASPALPTSVANRVSLAPDLFDHWVPDGDAVSAPHLQKVWVDFLGVKALFCIKNKLSECSLSQ